MPPRSIPSWLSNRCWSKKATFRCELFEGHLPPHRAGEVIWLDLASESGIIDVETDRL